MSKHQFYINRDSLYQIDEIWTEIRAVLRNVRQWEIQTPSCSQARVQMHTRISVSLKIVCLFIIS